MDSVDSAPEVKCFINEVRCSVVDALFKRRRNASPTEGNFCRAFQLAYKWTADNGYFGVPADKGGGMCLVRESDLRQLTSAKLQLPTYLPVSPHQAALNYTALHGALRNFEKAFEADGLCRWHMIKVRTSRGAFASRVQVNLKVQKPRGQVDVRIIHSSSSHPLAFIEKMIVGIIRPRLQMPHLYHSTDDFLEALNSRQFSPACKFIKMDVDNFYMQGTDEDLVQHPFEHLPPAQCKAAKELLRVILLQQFVVSEPLQQYYQVYLGSGQGRITSGELSDMCFFKLVEKNFLCQRDVQQLYNIELYGRYRDDCIIIINPYGPGLGTQAELIREVRHRIRRVYTVK